ncbi:hypothetical protein BDW02DRAFT_600351 [Decorospora gaudefroyi]|uniref:Uncharacterized protein n=1 Tax=Decorospora gaudefroyi TaxID=184978 RepID=A0A6A5K3X8_9PLEO|nr:hypothetical protein BDW02DRAFT_600351 [Decorospora gaudefroyi]
MTPQDQCARELYAKIGADIGDYPHWTLDDFNKCLSDGVSEASITAQYKLAFDAYRDVPDRAESGGSYQKSMTPQDQRSRELNAKLRADIGDYPHWTLDDFIKCLSDGVSEASMTAQYKIAFDAYHERWTDEQIIAEYRKQTIEEPFEDAVENLRTEMVKKLGHDSFFTEAQIIGYMKRGVSRDLIVSKYEWNFEQGRILKRAKQLRKRMTQEIGHNPNVSNQIFVNKFREGKNDDEVCKWYHAENFRHRG